MTNTVIRRFSLILARCPYEDVSATCGYSLPRSSPLYFNQGPCSKFITPRPVYQEPGYTYSGRNVIRSALPPYSHKACQGREFSACGGVLAFKQRLERLQKLQSRGIGIDHYWRFGLWLRISLGVQIQTTCRISIVRVRYRKRNKDIPGANPSAGRVSPFGGENLKTLPSGVMRLSFVGLNESFPLNAIAVTIVGEERKFMVFLLPSLRALKFLYYPVSRSGYAKSTLTIPIERRQYCCRG